MIFNSYLLSHKGWYGTLYHRTTTHTMGICCEQAYSCMEVCRFWKHFINYHSFIQANWSLHRLTYFSCKFKNVKPCQQKSGSSWQLHQIISYVVTIHTKMQLIYNPRVVIVWDQSRDKNSIMHSHLKPERMTSVFVFILLWPRKWVMVTKSYEHHWKAWQRLS